ncbi:MAG: PAS domain S-box protein, partial [Desulfobaccales bacterium]
MTRKSAEQLLDGLEQRFQKLRDRAKAWPEACRQELEAEFQEFSRGLAAWREAGAAPEPQDPGGPGAQEAPDRSDTILRHVFSAIPDVLAVIDRDFNIVMSNWHGYEHITKEARQGLLKCYQVFHRRDFPCENCHVREIFATGLPQKIEKVNELDGRPLEFSAFPILDESGRVVMVAEHVRDITARHRSEEALRQSEERFRAIFEHAQVGISMTDLEGRYLQTNQALQQFLGYTAAELMSLDFTGVTHPEDLAAYARLRGTLVEGQCQHYSLEKRYVRKDGKIVWAHLMVALLRDAQGNPQNLISTYVDITAHKQAEMALRKSEERFRAIFEYAPVGISMTDLAGRVLKTNRVLQGLLGYTAEELRGRDSSETVHPEDRPESARLGKELLARKQRHFSMNTRLLRKDGEIVWGYVTVSLLRDVWGEPEYFVGTVIDITAQKQAEAELRESEKRFRLLAETIQDVFWITTADMRAVSYLSPGYVQVWGRPREQLYQAPASFRESIHPEDQERVVAEMVKGRQQETPWGQEYRIIKPGGEVRWIQDRGFPVRDDRNHLIMFTGVATDITERKALEQQLLQAQKMEVAGRLAGGVAHDFNNLIMAVMGYAELMRAKVLKGDPLYGFLEEILKATDRAGTLTRQLLTFSRQQIMKPQVVDLNRVVLDLNKMLERVLGEDVELEIMTDSGTAPVKADP